MQEADEEEILFKLGQAQLAKADETIARIATLQATPEGRKIAGLAKLKKRVKAERDFLNSVCPSVSSNLMPDRNRRGGHQKVSCGMFQFGSPNGALQSG
jgi:hypothetical protein